MDQFLSVLSGGVGGGILFFVLKDWISVRLKQSIQYEYSEKLESYKTDLNSKVEAIRHDYQVSKLRTSLFFDHQRNAFAALITKIAQLNEEWMKDYEPDVGLNVPVPSEGYRELKHLLYQHQLFLDDECNMAMSLVMDAYSGSFPVDRGDGTPPHQNDSLSKVNELEYLQPRIASIFRNKIGVQSDSGHLRELAILSAIKLVNGYHFLTIGIPPSGNLSSKKLEDAADMVALGESNFDELLELLTTFDAYLSEDGSWLHDVQLKVKQCLKILRAIHRKSLETEQ